MQSGSLISMVIPAHGLSTLRLLLVNPTKASVDFVRAYTLPVDHIAAQSNLTSKITNVGLISQARSPGSILYGFRDLTGLEHPLGTELS